MIFARNVTGPLTSLVKKIDAETSKNAKKDMGSFVVFLSDKESLFKELKQLAEKESLKQTILTIDGVDGPEAYNVAKEAEITVVLYNKRIVEFNHSFRFGELTDKAIEAIVRDVGKMVK